MSNGLLFTIAGTVGSLIGGWIPTLFGASAFSGWSILWSTVGGVAAVMLAYKYLRS